MQMSPTTSWPSQLEDLVSFSHPQPQDGSKSSYANCTSLSQKADCRCPPLASNIKIPEAVGCVLIINYNDREETYKRRFQFPNFKRTCLFLRLAELNVGLLNADLKIGYISIL